MKKWLLKSVLLLLLIPQTAGAASINFGISFSPAGAVVDGLFTFNITYTNPTDPSSAFIINSINYAISIQEWSLQAATDISANPQRIPCSNPINCNDHSDLPANSVTEIFLTYPDPTCPLCGEPQINNSATIISLQPAWSNNNYLLDLSGGININDSSFAIVGNTVSGRISYNRCMSWECPSYSTPTQFSLFIETQNPEIEVTNSLQTVPIPNSLSLLGLGLVGLGLLRRWRM